MRKVIQFFALGLLLIGAPLGSWYYLNKGFNERKDALDQLKDYGKIEVLANIDTKGRVITADSIRQRFSIVSFLDNLQPENIVVQHSEILNKQFAKDDGIALLTYVTNADSARLKAYSERRAKDETSQWYIVPLAPLEYAKMRKQVLADSLQSGKYFTFVDTTLTIRNYYDATDKTRVGELAKHIAMFVAPTKARPDLIFKREQEK